MKKLFLIIALLACSASSAWSADKLFESGFEANSAILHPTGTFVPWTITGIDASTGYDWTDDIRALGTGASDFGLYGAADHTWGTDTIIALVADPANASNQVLEFSAINTATNGCRLQVGLEWNLPGSTLTTEYYEKYRMRFDGFEELNTVGPASVEWLIIQQHFEHLVATPTCQVSNLYLSIHKGNGISSSTYWDLGWRYTDGCDSGWVYFSTPSDIAWHQTNTTVPIPNETWFTIEWYAKKGNGSTGRVIVYITPDGGTRTLLFDVTDYTEHPTRAGYYRESSPFCIYADNTSDTMATAGHPLTIYFDDFEYWNGLPSTTRHRLQTGGKRLSVGGVELEITQTE